jgi:hypothetical protein
MRRLVSKAASRSLNFYAAGLIWSGGGSASFDFYMRFVASGELNFIISQLDL